MFSLAGAPRPPEPPSKAALAPRKPHERDTRLDPPPLPEATDAWAQRFIAEEDVIDAADENPFAPQPPRRAPPGARAANRLVKFSIAVPCPTSSTVRNLRWAARGRLLWAVRPVSLGAWLVFVESACRPVRTRPPVRVLAPPPLPADAELSDESDHESASDDDASARCPLVICQTRCEGGAAPALEAHPARESGRARAAAACLDRSRRDG